MQCNAMQGYRLVLSSRALVDAELLLSAFQFVQSYTQTSFILLFNLFLGYTNDCTPLAHLEISELYFNPAITTADFLQQLKH